MSKRVTDLLSTILIQQDRFGYRYNGLFGDYSSNIPARTLRDVEYLQLVLRRCDGMNASARRAYLDSQSFLLDALERRYRPRTGLEILLGEVETHSSALVDDAVSRSSARMRDEQQAEAVVALAAMAVGGISSLVRKARKR